MTGKRIDRRTGAAGRHEVFQDFLAEMAVDDLPALRHLVSCPLCLEMARLLLLSGGEAPGGLSRPDRTGRTTLRPRRRHH